MENVTQIQFVDMFGATGPQGIIDVDTGSQFAINFAVSDIREPFSKKGTKSYKFKIVGSKEINKLLNHYYDINIVDGTYNNNHKQKVVVLRNGVIILDNAYMQLLQINKDSASGVFSDQLISYELEVGSDVTSFFTDITNKYLSDLDFGDMDHTYEAAEVIASYGNDSIRDHVAGTGGYKYVLPYTTLTKYRLEECRPAISVYEYWNRIHQAAGYQWQWTGFDSDAIRMDKLWIPYNGDKPKMKDQELFEVAAERTTDFTINSSPVAGYMTACFPVQFICDIEVLDLLNAYNPVTGIYTAPFYSGTSSLNATFKVSYTFNLINPSGGTAYLSETGGLPSVNKFWTWRPQCKVLNFTTSLFSTPAVLGLHTITTTPSTAYSVPSGTTTLFTGTVTTSTIPVTGISLNDQLKTYAEAAVHANNTTIFFKSAISGGTLIAVRPQLIVHDVQMIFIPNIDTYGYGNIVDMNDFVPQKIKQSDFIKAIANMYNLVIDIDPTNDKRIVYTPRDTYYDNGVQKDWTTKLVTDKTSNINFISDTNAKKVIYSYKADTDVANADYLAETKEIYGQQEYTLGNENIKGVETKEIIFSPTPIAQTSFGSYNPIWVGQTPKCNIRILIDGGVQTCGAYDIVNYNIGATEYGVTGITTYPMLTHQDNPDTPLFDINFGLCDKYFFDFTSLTSNNLFNMFWRRTIGQIDTGKLLTAYFRFNEYDISQLRLNDKIFVKDTWYSINTLQYDPNSFGPSKVSLMTIDDQLAITFPKTIKPGKPYGSFSEVSVLASVSRDIYESLNTNYADSSVLVLGTGNVISADTRNTVVIGDNRIDIESNTLYSDNISVSNLIVNGKSMTDSFVWDRSGDDIVAVSTGFAEPNILPAVDLVSDLGSASLNWKDIYLDGKIQFVDEITIGERIGSVGAVSVVLGGLVGTGLEASGPNAFATGDNSIASGTFAVVMGQDSVAQGAHSFAVGNTSLAGGNMSFVSGGNATASHYGEYARATFFFGAQADAQYGTVSYGYKTNGNTPTELYLDNLGGSARFTIPFNTMYAVELRGLAVDQATGDSAMWTGKGIVKNVAGTVSLVAAITPTQDQADASMATTVLGVAAVSNYLEIKGTGIAATSIYWHVNVSYTKIGI